MYKNTCGVHIGYPVLITTLACAIITMYTKQNIQLSYWLTSNGRRWWCCV